MRVHLVQQRCSIRMNASPRHPRPRPSAPRHGGNVNAHDHARRALSEALLDARQRPGARPAAVLEQLAWWYVRQAKSDTQALLVADLIHAAHERLRRGTWSTD